MEKKGFSLWFLCNINYLTETSIIYRGLRTTYYGQELLLLQFQFLRYLPLMHLKMIYCFVVFFYYLQFWQNPYKYIPKSWHQIRHFFQPKCTNIFFKYMLWDSLETLHWGASDEYPLHMFSWRNKKTLYVIYTTDLMLEVIGYQIVSVKAG